MASDFVQMVVQDSIRSTQEATRLGRRLIAGDAQGVNNATPAEVDEFMFAMFGAFENIATRLASEVDRLARRIAEIEGH